MSAQISERISALIEEELSMVIQRISTHFNLSPEEVASVVGSSVKTLPEPKTKAKKSPSKKSSEESKKTVAEQHSESKEKAEPKSLGENIPEDPASLARYSNTQLSGICKKKGLKCSGKKEELINRIIESNKEGSSSSESAPVKKSVQTTLASVKKTPSVVKSEPSVLKKIVQTAPRLHISRNAWGNYEHADSHLVFDKDDRVVIGKQSPDGTVLDIGDEDIDTCKFYKFEYRLPENLDKNKKNGDDVVIEEMEEELGEDDFEEDEVEEALSEEDDE